MSTHSRKGGTASGRKRPSPAKQRIVIVDDHPMMREGLAQLISNEPDLSVCGEASSAAQAFETIQTLAPDLAIVDISLPDKSGLELIKDTLALMPDLPILVVSMHDETIYAERVLRAGGRGYVMKQEGGKKLLAAIRRILAGEIHVSEKMASKLLATFSGRRTGPTASPIEQLTDRELEVFQLIGQGLATRQIAAQLHLSHKTIEVHRMNIKQKLGVSCAPELIRYAVRWVESQPASG